MPTFFFPESVADKRMDDYTKDIASIAEGVLRSEGMDLVLVECLRMKTRWLVRVFMDKEGGVTVEDCAWISQQLGDVLDVHDLPPGPYTLEVSSPGLDRPLVKAEDFLRFRGRRIDCRLRETFGGSRRLKGILLDHRSSGGREEVLVEVEGEPRLIPRELILKANLVYEGEL